jgi:hypothetical protein
VNTDQSENKCKSYLACKFIRVRVPDKHSAKHWIINRKAPENFERAAVAPMVSRVDLCRNLNGPHGTGAELSSLADTKYSRVGKI